MASIKTALCKNYMNGNCRFGNRCNFAHGQEDLKKRNRGPCWFYNNGGCSKSAELCTYEHIEVKGVKKPLPIQRPCAYFHTGTGCTKIDSCQFDHFELSESEWKYHFPGVRYPGKGYLNRNKIDSKKTSMKSEKKTPENIWSILEEDNIEDKDTEETPQLTKDTDFPVLSCPVKKQQNCWSTIPESVKSSPVESDDSEEESEEKTNSWHVLKHGDSSEFNPPKFDELEPEYTGGSWADFMEEEDKWQEEKWKNYETAIFV
jgi:hypothetical protein